MTTTRGGTSPISTQLAPRLILLTLLLLLPGAGAHAVFGSSTPPPDSQVEVGLARVEVVLTEDVILDFSGLTVSDLQGTAWNNGPTTHGASGNVLIVETRPLPDGIYIIEWKALSADTHTTRGQFLIAVGNATLTQRSGSQTDTTEAPGGGVRDGLARATYYAGLLLALGVPLFFLLIDPAREVPKGALATSGLLALSGAVGALVNLQGLAERAETTLGAIAPTKGGIFLTLRAAFLAASGLTLLLALVRAGSMRRMLLAFGALLAGAALVCTSLGSHSASVTEARGLAITTDAIHLLMASVWIGGVVALLFASRGRTSEEVAALVGRFSPIAMASVALLLATGTYASFRFLKRFDALWSEPYGRYVSAKILLLLVLVAFGAFHQRVLRPRLLRRALTGGTFQRVLAVEVCVMLLVVGAAGALATTSPPQDEVQVDTTPLVFEVENRTELTHVVLQVSPNPVTIGVQTVRVYLHPLSAAPIPNSTIVQLKIWPVGGEEPDTTLAPDKTGIGEWSAKAGHFTSAGTWNVQVLYQRPDEGFKKFTFQVPVVLPGQSPPGETS